GSRPGRGARDAPAASPLPPWPRHAVRHDRPAGASPHRTRDRYRDVSVDGHDVLAARDRDDTGVGGGPMVNDDAVLAQVPALLQQEQRVVYQVLTRWL